MDKLKIEDYQQRDFLKKKIFGLLNEREKGGQWEKFLDSLLIQISSYDNETFKYYQLYSKLSSCRFLSYKYFRKTVFDIMNLLSEDW